jgi:hypothetical protein
MKSILMKQREEQANPLFERSYERSIMVCDYFVNIITQLASEISLIYEYK